MTARATFVAAVVAAIVLATAGTAMAAQVDYPRNPPPSWLTQSFRDRVDAAGAKGVPIPLSGPSAIDVCPGAVYHEGGVGTGTCLVYPYGCTANFVYSSTSQSPAPATADGTLYLGSAGHCSDHVGDVVYGAVSTPGVGPSIVRIGTVSKRIEQYPDDGNVHDWEAIQVDRGLKVYPDSPVGGPQGIYDGCQVGEPLKYYGHGYEVEVAQGKPEGGAAATWYDDGYGWAGPALGGDSGSGVLDASNDEAVGDLTASAIVYLPAFLPGETIGSRITWILRYSGFYLVNADRTLARDTTSPCGSAGSTATASSTKSGKGGGGHGGRKKPKK